MQAGFVQHVPQFLEDFRMKISSELTAKRPAFVLPIPSTNPLLTPRASLLAADAGDMGVEK